MFISIFQSGKVAQILRWWKIRTILKTQPLRLCFFPWRRCLSHSHNDNLNMWMLIHTDVIQLIGKLQGLFGDWECKKIREWKQICCLPSFLIPTLYIREPPSWFKGSKVNLRTTFLRDDEERNKDGLRCESSTSHKTRTHLYLQHPDHAYRFFVK